MNEMNEVGFPALSGFAAMSGLLALSGARRVFELLRCQADFIY